MKNKIASIILATSLLAPVSIFAATTLTVKNEVKGTSIGTVSSVDGNCALNSNNGQSAVVTCDTNFFSNNITFPLKDNRGDHVAFISASNPLFGSARLDLRDPKNNQVLSTCYSDGECKITKAIDAQHTSGDYLISKKIGSNKIILIKNIDH
ncbi:hypothetical protein fh0823_22090 [Francisella halioticida]|uniref:Uncharacterized protein n=1 Tax=Francisella halioticida TaxID=549298 RepID=A0ABM6LXG4_9GAMM|nr:hypothetical protein [Francisella halioticida]ASG67218.1 hypothetical protein CDV26_01400 [Francisella halioticida]BCD92070.1 hypothetical protein fh0823_22090 [Francisella halioticida]